MKKRTTMMTMTAECSVASEEEAAVGAAVVEEAVAVAAVGDCNSMRMNLPSTDPPSRA